jgi:hypothetical protein
MRAYQRTLDALIKNNLKQEIKMQY